MGNNSEPVSITGAIGLVLSTGLTMVALLVPKMTPELQGAILGFGNAVIWLGAIWIARRNVTSLASPTLAEGTNVTVLTAEGTPNRIEEVGTGNAPAPAPIPAN